ncbi:MULTISPECIES: hypothetical protein [Streptomyces violaceusniger group]|uniref:Uncharacterized protein n=1 Tax=Streptomyces javensis TaxID=114698 RepID=A0ABP4HY16_9ACTN|nr:hypothetical protein [Streptomyces javensis]
MALPVGLLVSLSGFLAIGTVIRSTTATVTTLFGAMLIVQAFAPALPGAFGGRVAKYWPPSRAGGSSPATAIRRYWPPGPGRPSWQGVSRPC